MNAHPEALSAIVGALFGLLMSIVGGIVLLWVKRTMQTRDKQGELASRVTGVHVSLEHAARNIRDMRADMKDRFSQVDARLDSLPCKDLCANVTTLRREADERRKAMP